jgi:hypothetical protein
MIIRNMQPEISFQGPKFTRRSDLTPSTRLYIAFTALMAQEHAIWGEITSLSRQFLISRMFIYTLANTLEQSCPIIFGDNHFNPAVEEKLPYYYMLSLRLEGRCSIEAISTIMKRFNIKISSVGSISQVLQDIGSLLPNTFTTNNKHVKLAVFASDELFSKSKPILITVDPISSAILRIELSDTRNVEDWKRHWKCLSDNGYIAIYLTTDEGTSLCTAQKEALSDIIRQPDLYHAVAHQLGHLVNVLKKAAYKAIRKEYHCYDILDSAKSDDVINKRIDNHEMAKKIANEKIDLYDSFHFLYLCIIEELRIFDEDGNLRDREEAEANIKVALDLLETLTDARITKAVNKVRNTLPDLFNYFDIAKPIVDELMALPIDQESLKALFVAWQWGKEMIKSKKAKARQYCKRNEQLYLEMAMYSLQEDYDLIKEEVYMKLDQIIRSSALVECINSIIRPYLNNSKNHVTQKTLNLIMYYHNYRRYKDGKRKGKTPYEILTGERQKKDWIEILFDIVAEKKPDLFSSSR